MSLRREAESRTFTSAKREAFRVAQITRESHLPHHSLITTTILRLSASAAAMRSTWHTTPRIPINVNYSCADRPACMLAGVAPLPRLPKDAIGPALIGITAAGSDAYAAPFADSCQLLVG